MIGERRLKSALRRRGLQTCSRAAGCSIAMIITAPRPHRRMPERAFRPLTETGSDFERWLQRLKRSRVRILAGGAGRSRGQCRSLIEKSATPRVTGARSSRAPL